MYIVGKVLKPHGIKGNIKVYSYMDTPCEFQKLKEVYINGKLYEVTFIRATDKFVILSLPNIDSIELAEQLRDAEVSIKKDDAPQLPKGRFYIEDLIGCKIYIGTDCVGVLIDVFQYGSADIYYVQGDKKFMFPFVGDVVKEIDIKRKTIILNSDELKKVAVYED